MANRDEVEEFLRRAAMRRMQAEAQARAKAQQRGQFQQPAQPQGQFPQQPQGGPVQQGYPQPQRNVQQTWTPPPQRPATLTDVVMLEPVEIVDAEMAELGSSVSQHVAQHIRGVNQGEEHDIVGASVDQADERLESRLHRTFDHKIGQLTRSTMEAAADSPSAAARSALLPGAASIAQMLLDPHSLRNAVILVEILRRPEDPWE